MPYRIKMRWQDRPGRIAVEQSGHCAAKLD
jgi:hypothetical protein